MANGDNFLNMTIDGKELREFVKTLDAFEPGLRKQFVKDIKSEIKPLADTIASKINSTPIGTEGYMRGFRHNGRTAWSKVRASVYATPGGGRSASVARIEVFGQGDKKAALKIADLAGTKGNFNNGNYSKGGNQPYFINGQGEDLVSRLSEISTLSARGKGGRLVWKNFIGQRRQMIDIAIKIMDRYAARVNSGGKP
jgi:hypothetical protein